MQNLVAGHLGRLRVICAAMLASLPIYAAVVLTVPFAERPALAQGGHFLWIFAAISVLNLVTVMPVYRAMLAGARRVFAVSGQPGPLLRAHATAHLVAFARLEAVAILGLVLYFLSARIDWFAVFAAVAAVGMLVLWPARSKVTALLVAPGIGTQPIQP